MRTDYGEHLDKDGTPRCLFCRRGRLRLGALRFGNTPCIFCRRIVYLLNKYKGVPLPGEAL